jgi:hypothetical protein
MLSRLGASVFCGGRSIFLLSCVRCCVVRVYSNTQNTRDYGTHWCIDGSIHKTNGAMGQFEHLILAIQAEKCSVMYRSFNISQPYRPPRPVTGIALLYGDGVCFL